ncbi:hypothetical protein F8M41_006992 [Gigaspora margarita]|uniref:Uncharacterized protein n=1 Tax=Gigaspora margarita TaxID=4874 RepID=A0A8H3X8K4_GIGMA|nr:hypothetical protein F8M41_006992 [Gigaspora margarita]
MPLEKTTFPGSMELVLIGAYNTLSFGGITSSFGGTLSCVQPFSLWRGRLVNAYTTSTLQLPNTSHATYTTYTENRFPSEVRSHVCNIFPLERLVGNLTPFLWEWEIGFYNTQTTVSIRSMPSCVQPFSLWRGRLVNTYTSSTLQLPNTIHATYTTYTERTFPGSMELVLTTLTQPSPFGVWNRFLQHTDNRLHSEVRSHVCNPFPFGEAGWTIPGSMELVLTTLTATVSILEIFTTHRQPSPFGGTLSCVQPFSFWRGRLVNTYTSSTPTSQHDPCDLHDLYGKDFSWEHGIGAYNTHGNRLHLEVRSCVCNPSPLGEAGW